MLSDITPLILTYNEAPNIERTLSRLTWAARIVVVDSFSTDETEAICRRHPRVDLIQRKFDDHTTQWNFGLARIETEWGLSLDADYVLSDGLVAELTSWTPADGVNAYFASFKYCVHGRPLRGTLYPPRAVLFRKDQCRYEQDGHTQRLRVEGNSGWLRGFIDHDDRKPLARWFSEQVRYAELEAEHLMRDHGLRDYGTTRPEDGTQRTEVRSQKPGVSSPTSDLRPPISKLRSPIPGLQTPISDLRSPISKLSLPDRVRRLVVVAPFAIFFYTLFGKGLILDGWPGWYYVFQRTVAEMILSLRLMEQKLKS